MHRLNFRALRHNGLHCLKLFAGVMRSYSARNNSATTKETRASGCCAEFEFSHYTIWQMATIYARMRFWVCNGMLDRLLAALRELHLIGEISRKSGRFPPRDLAVRKLDHPNNPTINLNRARCPAVDGFAFGTCAESGRLKRCEPSCNRTPAQRMRPRPKQNSSISTDQALAFLAAVHSTAIFFF